MTKERIDSLVGSYSGRIGKGDLILVSELLTTTPDSRYKKLTRLTLKNKVTALLFAIFLGMFGVHRFYLGDIVIGVLRAALTVIMIVLSCVLYIVAPGFGWIATLVIIGSAVWYSMEIYFGYVRAEQVNFKKISAYL